MDYKALGFKCGIEIHQQLEGEKLFCSCPTVITKEKPDFTITRTLRAAAGESGKVDIAAKHEQEKRKQFKYQGYNEFNCLVEIDEEPPHEVNKAALKTTLQLAQLLNAKIVDEIRFMRKTVVDGSNVSGFQRTALIAENGFVEVNGRKIGIEAICLEEEAAQTIERTNSEDTYNLSRLGIPLIEIATAPDITSPEECKEVSLKIGMALRSLDGMKRGIGSIRQDVNVSIKEGVRVEIKGFQDVKNIPTVINYEIERQQKEIKELRERKEKKKMESHVRKAESDGTTSFLRPMPGSARMYPETDVAAIIPEIEKLGKIELLEDIAKRLEKDYNISKDLALKIAKTGKTELFEGSVSDVRTIKPSFIADMIISIPTEIRRKENIEVNLTAQQIESILKELETGKISKDHISTIMLNLGKTGKLDFSKYELVSEKEARKILEEVVAKNKNAPFGALIGEAMKALQGKADGKIVSKILKELTN